MVDLFKMYFTLINNLYSYVFRLSIVKSNFRIIKIIIIMVYF